MKTKEFKVSIPHVPGASVGLLRQYIEDAVRSWCGQAVTDDWESALGVHGTNEKIKVTRLYKPR